MSNTKPVRKAVFPVGGLGTRFLPATKAMPKEMLPVVDKPLIQYAVEEARAAGIEELIFVTGRNKTAIEDHFDQSFELEWTLQERGKHDQLTQLRRWLPKAGNVSYTRQQEPMGLGHAVWCARHLVGNEPFAVLLADDLVLADRPCLSQMVEVYEQKGGNVVAAMDVAPEHTSRYGIIDIAEDDGRLVTARGMVEKPKSDGALRWRALRLRRQGRLHPGEYRLLAGPRRSARPGEGLPGRAPFDLPRRRPVRL